jgi:putative oxidoreductase
MSVPRVRPGPKGYELDMTPVRTTARAMLAAIFVSGGAKALTDPGRLAARAKPLTDRIAPHIERVSPSLPTDPEPLVRVNGAVQLVAGLLLLTRLRRPAAAALAASMVPTTLAGHPFWQYKDPHERSAQRANFLKNVGLTGGLLLAALDNNGKPGVRWQAGHLAHHSADAVRRNAAHTRSMVRVASKAGKMGRRIGPKGS